MRTNTLPKISFTVDRNAEKRVTNYFLNTRKKNLTGMDEFGKFIRDFQELHKTKELSKKEAQKIIFPFIEKYYHKNEQELLKKRREIEQAWQTKAEGFFLATQKIFDNHPWPKGKYTANLSIFAMYRLKPNTKVFSIPIDDAGGYENATGHINYTLIHELMHIYVEDYYKKYFKDSLQLDQYYDLLEIVNFIALNLPKIKEYAVWFTNPYPNHRERCAQAQKFYAESKSMKEFFKGLISYLKETKDQ